MLNTCLTHVKHVFNPLPGLNLRTLPAWHPWLVLAHDKLCGAVWGRSPLALQARYDVRTDPEPLLSVQGGTNPELWPNGGWTNLTDSFSHRSVMVLTYSVIGSATVRLWFTYVRTHPFTFWFSRTDPEPKMPAGWYYQCRCEECTGYGIVLFCSSSRRILQIGVE